MVDHNANQQDVAEATHEVTRSTGWYFTKVINRPIEDRSLSIYAKMVYVVLSYHADLNGNDCYPSHITIGEEAGCSDRQVRRAIEELIQSGYITRKRRGLNKSNKYIVVQPTVVWPDKSVDNTGDEPEETPGKDSQSARNGLTGHSGTDSQAKEQEPPSLEPLQQDNRSSSSNVEHVYNSDEGNQGGDDVPLHILAAERIDALLSHKELPHWYRTNLPDMRARFNRGMDPTAAQLDKIAQAERVIAQKEAEQRQRERPVNIIDDEALRKMREPE